MLYLILLVSVQGFNGIYEETPDPGVFNRTYTSLYVRSPLTLSVLHASLKSYDDITNPANASTTGYKYLFMVFAAIGLVVAGYMASTQGTPAPVLKCLLIDLLIYVCFIRVGTGSEINLNCYSGVDNWTTYLSDPGIESGEKVAVPLGLFLNIVGGITRITTHFADKFGENLTGYSYKNFPYLMGDAIKEMLEADHASEGTVKRVDKYFKGCIAPALEKAYREGNNIGSLKEIVDYVRDNDIMIQEPILQRVLSCDDYYEEIEALLTNEVNQTYSELSSAAGVNPADKETYALRFGPGDIYGANATQMHIALSLGKETIKAGDKFTQYAEHQSGGQRSKAFRFFSKIFGSAAEYGTSFLGGIVSDTLWRAFPYISAFAIGLYFLGLPIIILFSLIPGGRMIIIEYLRGLIWVFSWLPFTVAATGIINSFTQINTVNRVMADLSRGIVELGTMQRLSVTSSIAQGVGSIFVILIPIMSYAIIARGSFAGMAQGIGTAGGTMVAAGSKVINTAVGAATTAGGAAVRKGK